MTQVKPLLAIRELIEWWPILEPDFVDLMQYGFDDDDTNNILQRAAAGQLIIWVALKDGKYIGFVTTKAYYQRYQGEDVKVLFLNHVYQRDKNHGALYAATAEFFKDYAKRSGCKLIKGLTARNVERYMNRIGFTKTYTEFQMVLDDEDLQ